MIETDCKNQVNRDKDGNLTKIIIIIILTIIIIVIKKFMVDINIGFLSFLQKKIRNNCEGENDDVGD